jgi:murein L,D-transpeptidase YafK
MLEMALSQINDQQPTQALATLDTLIQHYPHFQLAHMMRADILFAQANALTSIGAQLSNQQTQSLQAEARARLTASKQLAEQQQPAYVLGDIPSSLKHLITIDLTASRAYLFHVDQQQLAFSGSFYVTQGSKGAGKEKEGDKRTPVGVYRLTKPIPAQKLSSFYGAGALPLDYPNSWDKRNQRTGHGIWLHGTPLEQYSRPPLASDGCVVFSNDDMSYLLNQVDWQATRIITDHQLHWKKPGNKSAAEEVKQRVESWRRSWEQRQLQPYLAFYAADFRSTKNENKAQWSARKQQLFNVDQQHQIHISQLLALSYPAQTDVVLTEFDQRYQRGSKIDVERKRLWWQQQQGEWLIIHEEVLNAL